MGQCSSETGGQPTENVGLDLRLQIGQPADRLLILEALRGVKLKVGSGSHHLVDFQLVARVSADCFRDPRRRVKPWEQERNMVQGIGNITRVAHEAIWVELTVRISERRLNTHGGASLDSYGATTATLHPVLPSQERLRVA